MNRKNSRIWAAAAVCGAALSLAACGGGGGGNGVGIVSTPATSQVPASASASVSGWISYLRALVVSQSDTLSPVDVSNVTPPTDETSSPTPVD